MHRFMSVFQLMSRLPVRVRREPDFSAASLFIPFMGLFAGLAGCSGAAVGMALFGPGLAAAVAAMTAQYLAFNLFHLDGLLDTADALGVPGDTERRRAVLKDPRIGSYGFFAGFALLSGRLAATADLLAAGWTPALAALLLAPPAGRLAAMLAAWRREPAAPGGLASVVGRVSLPAATAGYLLAVVPSAVLFGMASGPWYAAVVVVAGFVLAAATGLAVGRLYSRKFGGYTGDALGAAVEIGELLALLTAAAAFRFAI